MTPPPTQSSVSKYREFKITGQIGDRGQVGKLTYLSLSSQIVSGRRRGFHEEDICAAVMKAIVPDNPLRSYLEMEQLSLAEMIPVLCNHFGETDATSVFTQLTNAAQKPGQSVHAFCMELMGIRGKVIAISELEGGHYTPGLVQKQFQQSLNNGIIDNSIRQQLSPTLEIPGVTDVAILEKINKIVKNEAAHSAKTNAASSSVPATVNNINTTQDTNNKQKKENPILAEVTKLAAAVSKLEGMKTEFQQWKEDMHRQPVTGFGYGCCAGEENFDRRHGGNAARGGPIVCECGTVCRGTCQTAAIAAAAIAAAPDNTPAPAPAPVMRGGYSRGRGFGGGGRGGGRPGTCSSCVMAGSWYCPHCFKCGGTGHKSTDPVCPRNQASNQQGTQM